VVVVDDLKLDTPKTKGFTDIVSKLELAGTALFVAAAQDKNLNLASRNIQDVELTTSDLLNTYQVLRSDKLVFTRSAFEKLQERLQD
jgi:large subunit ribosomal protein L4